MLPCATFQRKKMRRRREDARGLQPERHAAVWEQGRPQGEKNPSPGINARRAAVFVPPALSGRPQGEKDIAPPLCGGFSLRY